MKTNRRLLSALMAAVMIITIMPFGLVASAVDETIYEISSADELVAFAKAFNDKTLASTYTTVQLTKDIDMSSVSTWTAIGSKDNKFALTFDGQNHVITNLTAKGTEDATLGGIFGYVSGTIKNLAVTDSSFNYTKDVGAIATNLSGTIENCAVYNTDINIDLTSTSLHVNRAGGIVAFLNGGTITDSYSKANIYISDTYGVNYAGGIAGYAQSGAKVTNAYYAGNMASVAGVYNVAGGIVGRSYETEVSNCYVAGLVTGDISGAIAGWINDDTTLTNNYYYTDSNLYEYQKNAEDSFVGTAGNACAAADLTAAKLNGESGTAYGTTSVVRIDGYTFPLLTNNAFDDVTSDSPDMDITLGLGRGTLTSPYIISTKSQLSLISKHLNSAFSLSADISFDEGETFTPIGTAGKPFSGYFNGNGHTIRGLVINSTSDSAAMFINNYGVIKNFTLTEVEKVDAVAAQEATYDPDTGEELTPAVDAVEGHDAIPSSVTLNTSVEKASAAAIVVTNYGKVSDVTSEANVTLTSDKYMANAAGIVAVNYGVVENCTNTGNIFVDNTAVIDDANSNYKTVFEKATVNVAGLVAINNASGTVSGSSSDTSRSLLTSAPNTNGIAQGQFVALNNGSDASVSCDATTDTATAKYGAFTFTMQAKAAHRGTGEFSDTNPVDFTLCSAAYNGTAITAEPEDTYSTVADNYQKISLTYTNDSKTYDVVFIGWLDYTDVTMDATNVKTSYLLGENFSSSGLTVTGKTSTGSSVTLNKVENDNSNGYVVKIYDMADPENPVLVDDLSTVEFSGTQHDYTVKVSYYGDPVGEYTITVYGVKTLSVTPDYTTYLAGATPEIKVKAVYGDPSNTTKTVTTKNYTYAIDTDKEANTVTSYVSPVDVKDGNATAPTFPSAGTYYIYVKSGDVYGKSTAITVVASDTKVSSFTATAGSADNEIECDNIQLNWTYTGSTSENVTFKIERQRVLDVTKYDDIDTQTLLDAAGTLTYTTVKSGITGTTYTDTKTETGEEYKYRITVQVSGEDSTSTYEIEDVEPASPKEYSIVAPTGKDLYFALGDELGHDGLTVNAVYANGTKEGIKYSSEETNDILKYYIESDFDSSESGDYTVNVKHVTRVGWFGIGTKYGTLGSYTVHVVDPTNVNYAKAKYSIYPEGYKLDDYKSVDNLTVKVEYWAPLETPEKLATRTLTDNSSITITGYDSTKLNEEQTLTISSSLCTDKTDSGAYTGVKVTFVKSVAPSAVVATPQTDGTIDLEWTKVAGAKSYNIYRSTSENGTYELVATKSSTASVTVKADETVSGTDESDTLDSGTTYYYKVKGVIGGVETDYSPASNAVTTAVPAYYTIDVGDAKTDFAIGEKFTTRGVDVFAYYVVGGTTEEPEYKAVELKTRKYTATCTATLDEDNKITTAGTYNVSITINDNTDKTVTYVDGDTPTGLNYYTITAYDIAAIEATIKKDAYPLNYEFSKSDIKLKAVYGANIGATDGSEVIAKRKTVSADDEGYVLTVAPDTTTVGTKTATVTYGGFTASVSVNVYDPDATVAVKGKANEDLTASLIITTSAVKFVKSYTVIRSTSYDMDTDLKTVKVYEGSSTVTSEEDFLIYKDSSVKANTTYYYTVTPTFLDGAVGTSSAFVQITTLTEAEKLVITPESNVGVSRSDNYLLVDAPAVGGINVDTFMNDDLTNAVTQMKVFDANGNPLTEGYITTGCVIKLYAASDTAYETAKDTVTVIIKGDVNADGIVSSPDYVLIKKEIMGTPIVGEANRKAADIKSDSKINSSDYVTVKKIIMAR